MIKLQNAPLISVIIPTYNRAHLIQKSILSVLNQTYSNFELIVVDDSNDDTELKIKEIQDGRLIYIKNNRREGVSKARNLAIGKAKGELIAFQDSDDEWLPEKLEKQVLLLLSSSEDVAAVYCGQELFDIKTGKKLGEDLQNPNLKVDFISGNHLPHTPSTQTVLIKKSVLDEVGYFDERMQAAEDTELAIRVSKKYSYAYVNEPLIKVARNHNSLMGNAKNYTVAKEILIQKHDTYLSKIILFGLCKEIANYYILTNNYTKAKEFVRKSFKYHFNLKTMIQYIALNMAPSSIGYFFNKKYKKGIPHPNLAGQYLSGDDYQDY